MSIAVYVLILCVEQFGLINAIAVEPRLGLGISSQDAEPTTIMITDDDATSEPMDDLTTSLATGAHSPHLLRVGGREPHHVDGPMLAAATSLPAPITPLATPPPTPGGSSGMQSFESVSDFLRMSRRGRSDSVRSMWDLFGSDD